MEGVINWDGYKVSYKDDEFESDALEIHIYDPSMGHDFPVFYMKLKGLWEINKKYKQGDYYQETMEKFHEVKANDKISYAAILHSCFMSNSEQFPNIKNIYSSCFAEKNQFITPDTKRFWEKQLAKNIGVEFDGDRYKLKIND